MKDNGNDILKSTITGKHIKDSLDLTTIPSLRTKSQKKYFYVVESGRMADIKTEYTDLQNDGPGTAVQPDNDWIEKFAKKLKTLKDQNWHNSIDGLPVGKSIANKNMLLLWKLDDGFANIFYSESSQQDTTPRAELRTKSNDKSQHTTTTRLSVKAVSGGTYLTNEFAG